MDEYEFNPYSVISIDPSDCGCSGCESGDHIGVDDYRIGEVFDLISRRVITPANNAGEGSLIIYRTRSGSMNFTPEPSMLEYSDNRLIHAYHDFRFLNKYEEYIVIEPDSPWLHAQYGDSEYDTMIENIELMLANEDRFVNNSGLSLMPYREYSGNVGLVVIPTTDVSSVSILWA